MVNLYTKDYDVEKYISKKTNLKLIYNIKLIH